VLVDANILLYAVDERSPRHAAAREWLEGALNGERRVGIPWQSVTAFIRIASHPRVLDEPITPAEAWSYAEDWLDAPATWIPQPGAAHRRILGELVVGHDLGANLIPDAALAALCVEHGLEMISADSDFARFPEIRWRNPLA
jgi:uncharacterized protein